MGGYHPPSDDDRAHPFITTVAGQAITAAPTAVAFAGTTLTPGAPGERINGTLVSLNTANQLVLGSKTVALQSEGGKSGSQETSPSSSSSNGTGNLTNTSGGGGTKVFEGNAAALLKNGLSSSSLSLLLLLLLFSFSSFAVSFLGPY